MPTSTYFGGVTQITPGVSSVIDEAALAAAGVNASSVIGLVGASTGGKPKFAYAFSSAAQAAAVLRSGSLLDCVRKAFDPGGNSPGAAAVIAIRVATPLVSTLTLNDAVAAQSIVLTSQDYGVWTTQIRVKVETGTTRGKKITVAAPVNGVIQTVVTDNIYRAAFSVQYTGAAAASAMTINSTSIVISNTGSVDNITILFSNATTIQQVVDTLNATGKYNAATLSDPTAASSTCDGVTSQDIKTATYTETSILQACIDFFNGVGDPFLTAVKGASATLPPVNIGFTYLTGGSDGSAATTQDFTDALVVLESQSAGIVLAASGDANVHAVVLAHVNAMSGAGGKRERIGIVGGVAAETVAQAATRAANIGSQRVGLVFPGISDFDPNGVLTAYPPFYTAAAVAGVLAGGAVNRAATFRLIGAQALEKSLTDAEVVTLLSGGVIPIQFAPGRGNRIVQSLSTWTADANYAHVELSVRRTADAVAASVRSNLEGLVGFTSGPGLVTEVTAVVDSTLRIALANGLIVGNSTNPPYKNIQVSISGDVVNVTFAAQVGVPANYITITAHLSGFAA